MRILAWPGVEAGETNPYTRLLYESVKHLGHTVDEFTLMRAFSGKYDIFHIHWPEYYVGNPNLFKSLFGSLGILLAMNWCRLRGAKIVWTAHNLRSHREPRPRIEKLFWGEFTKRIDASIAMTHHGLEELRLTYPHLQHRPNFVIPHGSYRGAYPNRVTKTEARVTLRIPPQSRVICFLGSIASYKGISQLVSVFRQLDASDLRLLIAGAVDNPSEAAFLESQAREDDRITLRLGFVSSELIQFYLNASDLVAIPFRRIWNSGSAMLALSFDRPILVPSCGPFAELQEQLGASWVRTYVGELTPCELKEGLAWAIGTERSASAPLDKFEWPGIAEETVRLYKRLAKHGEAQAASSCVREREQRTG